MTSTEIQVQRIKRFLSAEYKSNFPLSQRIASDTSHQFTSNGQDICFSKAPLEWHNSVFAASEEFKSAQTKVAGLKHSAGAGKSLKNSSHVGPNDFHIQQTRPTRCIEQNRSDSTDVTLHEYKSGTESLTSPCTTTPKTKDKSSSSIPPFGSHQEHVTSVATAQLGFIPTLKNEQPDCLVVGTSGGRVLLYRFTYKRKVGEPLPPEPCWKLSFLLESLPSADSNEFHKIDLKSSSVSSSNARRSIPPHNNLNTIEGISTPSISAISVITSPVVTSPPIDSFLVIGTSSGRVYLMAVSNLLRRQGSIPCQMSCIAMAECPSAISSSVLCLSLISPLPEASVSSSSLEMPPAQSVQTKAFNDSSTTLTAFVVWASGDVFLIRFLITYHWKTMSQRRRLWNRDPSLGNVFRLTVHLLPTIFPETSPPAQSSEQLLENNSFISSRSVIVILCASKGLLVLQLEPDIRLLFKQTTISSHLGLESLDEESTCFCGCYLDFLTNAKTFDQSLQFLIFSRNKLAFVQIPFARNDWCLPGNQLEIARNSKILFEDLYYYKARHIIYRNNSELGLCQFTSDNEFIILSTFQTDESFHFLHIMPMHSSFPQKNESDILIVLSSSNQNDDQQIKHSLDLTFRSNDPLCRVIIARRLQIEAVVTQWIAYHILNTKNDDDYQMKQKDFFDILLLILSYCTSSHMNDDDVGNGDMAKKSKLSENETSANVNDMNVPKYFDLSVQFINRVVVQVLDIYDNSNDVRQIFQLMEVINRDFLICLPWKYVEKVTKPSLPLTQSFQRSTVRTSLLFLLASVLCLSAAEFFNLLAPEQWFSKGPEFLPALIAKVTTEISFTSSPRGNDQINSNSEEHTNLVSQLICMGQLFIELQCQGRAAFMAGLQTLSSPLLPIEEEYDPKTSSNEDSKDIDAVKTPLVLFVLQFFEQSLKCSSVDNFNDLLRKLLLSSDRMQLENGSLLFETLFVIWNIILDVSMQHCFAQCVLQNIRELSEVDLVRTSALFQLMCSKDQLNTETWDCAQYLIQQLNEREESRIELAILESLFLQNQSAKKFSPFYDQILMKRLPALVVQLLDDDTIIEKFLLPHQSTSMSSAYLEYLLLEQKKSFDWILLSKAKSVMAAFACVGRMEEGQLVIKNQIMEYLRSWDPSIDQNMQNKTTGHFIKNGMEGITNSHHIFKSKMSPCIISEFWMTFIHDIYFESYDRLTKGAEIWSLTGEWILLNCAGGGKFLKNIQMIETLLKLLSSHNSSTYQDSIDRHLHHIQVSKNLLSSLSVSLADESQLTSLTLRCSEEALNRLLNQRLREEMIGESLAHFTSFHISHKQDDSHDLPMLCNKRTDRKESNHKVVDCMAWIDGSSNLDISSFEEWSGGQNQSPMSNFMGQTNTNFTEDGSVYILSNGLTLGHEGLEIELGAKETKS